MCLNFYTLIESIGNTERCYDNPATIPANNCLNKGSPVY